MRIGLLSDTHIPEACKELWTQVARAFKGVDLIIHAGDTIELGVLDWLESIAPVLAAEGNHDYYLPEDPRLKPTHVLKINGFRLGAIHLFSPDYEPVTKLIDFCFRQPLDIVVFGDTHWEVVERKEGILFVNPGSPTYPRNMSTRLGTVGILEITNGNARAEIIDLRNIL